MPTKTESLILLNKWAKASETYWSTIPGHSQWGVYGTGYNGWGVQTTQKYLAAMATLCHYGKDVPGADTQWAKDRALAALRFNLASHKSGNAHCTDAADWQERAHCFLINGISIPGDAIWLFASATPPCCTFDFKTAGRAPKAWIKRNIILSPIPMLLPCIFPSHCFLAARS